MEMDATQKIQQRQNPLDRPEGASNSNSNSNSNNNSGTTTMDDPPSPSTSTTAPTSSSSSSSSSSAAPAAAMNMNQHKLRTPTTVTTRAAHRADPTTATPSSPLASSSATNSPTIDSTSITPLQRHFHHQRHQSSSEVRTNIPGSPSPLTPTASTSSPQLDGAKLSQQQQQQQQQQQRPNSVNMPLTGDHRPVRSPETTPRGMFSNWLPGTGSPADRAAESPLQSKGAASATTPSATPTKLRKNPSTPQAGAANAATSSPGNNRFAFLSSSLSALTRGAQTSNTARYDDPDDELLHLNIQDALFPPESPSGPRDPFSPAAFKNLETTATGLLHNFQNAYRRQADELRDLRNERAAQADEVEENETRAQHLKLQLENMAKQAAEREKEMQALLATLEKERAMYRETLGANGAGVVSDRLTIDSEDLGAEEDQERRRRDHWRKSTSVGDTTDEEESVGEAPSVFSRSRSPTLSTMTSSASVVGGAPASVNTTPTPAARLENRNSVVSQSPAQVSPFQKLIKGITGEGDRAAPSVGRGPAACSNCRGQDGQIAWDTVGLLRDENRGLKVRVADLESCVEGALDAVNGLKF